MKKSSLKVNKGMEQPYKFKGFTLIELLAVIIVLAVIALIATPIILNVIENARRKAAETTVLNYVKIVERTIALQLLEGEVYEGRFNVENNKITFTGILSVSPLLLDISGDLPSGGFLDISNGMVEYGEFTVSRYLIIYREGNAFASPGGPSNEMLEAQIAALRQEFEEYKNCYLLINSPHLWEIGREYEFCDGTFGQRFTGTITIAANTDHTVNFDLGATRIVTSGGYFFNTRWRWEIGHYQTPNVFSRVLMDAQNGFASFMSRHDAARTNAPYDIWIRYTK